MNSTTLNHSKRLGSYGSQHFRTRHRPTPTAPARSYSPAFQAGVFDQSRDLCYRHDAVVSPRTTLHEADHAALSGLPGRCTRSARGCREEPKRVTRLRRRSHGLPYGVPSGKPVPARLWGIVGGPLEESLRDSIDTCAELPRAKGFAQIVISTPLERGGNVRFPGSAGHNKDMAVAEVTDTPQYLVAIDIGQTDIDRHECRRGFAHKFHALQPGRSRMNVEAGLSQYGAHEIPDIEVVFDDDGCALSGGQLSIDDHDQDLHCFGSPADRVGPVALRPRLAPGLPLSMSGRPYSNKFYKTDRTGSRVLGPDPSGGPLLVKPVL
jgi:hypothetical protein